MVLITHSTVCRYLMLLRKRRNQKNAGDRPQYELDFDLSPLEKHFMFWEYLEIGKSLDRPIKNNG